MNQNPLETSPSPEAAGEGGATLAIPASTGVDWLKWLALSGGFAVFLAIYFAESPAAAVDPAGKAFPLSHEGKAAIGLFLLAALWWVTNVLPLGITAIAIGVFQALFLIRAPKAAFGDFMDPAVWFIFASVVIGVAFTKSGLTLRLAYKMLTLVGERTSMIYLGCFVVTTLLTLLMAHTAVAATIFPVLLAIYALYGVTDRPTRFGKGLFIGMAFSAGAGSIITLLGSARGIVGLTFFRDITGERVGFFDIPYYLAPVGITMMLVTWGLMLLLFPPEKKSLPGLKEIAARYYRELGPVKRDEWLSLAIVTAAIGLLAAQTVMPILAPISRPAILLVTTLLFFMLGVLTLKELEDIPWNIILLFGGAMSIGFCLWETGAAEWLAIHWLSLFQDAHWLLFLLGLGIFVLTMTNIIMNVAAIAITLPVALVIAGYLSVSPEVILYITLTAAGMPFLFLVGAAPNAIAYQSNQFTPMEFFKTGIPASIALLAVLSFAIAVLWPMLGMSVSLR
jgi:sodium-dependent dicarboxylate transporter 2/3/5